MQRSIALIGLSGTGKSTVGRLLAARLAVPFADTDALIVQAAGRPVRALFVELGEPAFRAIESATLRAALERGPQVIATGGGIVLSLANRELLRAQARCIWLDAPDGLLVQRLLAHDEERPLLQGDPHARIAAMRGARAPLYAELAEQRIDSSACTAPEIAAAIAENHTYVL
jgi:shikimate kinase